jgi:SpoVK/Ycf46/Vps4 family AAA+-type ATPase
MFPFVEDDSKATLGRQQKGEIPDVSASKAREKGEPPGAFTVEEPSRSFDELIVADDIRLEIEAALCRIQQHETLYVEWGLQEIDRRGRSIAVNLYGPPGTGKSMCAEVIAYHLGKRLIRVSYAELESKYVGDTPKNIVASFHAAQSADAVLFFDEADSILGRRLSSVTQSADHGVNVSRSVMLTSLDKFEGVVVFATNFPGNYDQAFVRRILAHIEFRLPDKQTRLRLWSKLLPSKLPRRGSITPEYLASISDGLSGADMVNVVVKAATLAVARKECRLVTEDDVARVIGNIRMAQQSVGARGQVTMKEEICSKEEADRVLKEYESRNYNN